MLKRRAAPGRKAVVIFQPIMLGRAPGREVGDSFENIIEINIDEIWFSQLNVGVGSFPGGASDKEPTCQCRKRKRPKFDPWVGEILWRRAWQPTPIFVPGECHGEGSLWATVHRVTKSRTRLGDLACTGCQRVT